MVLYDLFYSIIFNSLFLCIAFFYSVYCIIFLLITFIFSIIFSFNHISFCIIIFNTILLYSVICKKVVLGVVRNYVDKGSFRGREVSAVSMYVLGSEKSVEIVFVGQCEVFVCLGFV